MASQAANQENALFIDLNAIIADRYDKDTEAKVKSTYFGTDHVHTIEAGAKVNAACVIAGLLQLKGKPFKKYVNKKIWRDY